MGHFDLSSGWMMRASCRRHRSRLRSLRVWTRGSISRRRALSVMDRNAACRSVSVKTENHVWTICNSSSNWSVKGFVSFSRRQGVVVVVVVRLANTIDDVEFDMVWF